MEPGAGPLPRGARGASPACVPGRRGVVGAQPLITPPPATREGRSGGEGYLIRAEHLAKHYGSVHAVRDLNLAVRPGEIYGFLGPNGAGKTTTLLMLLGIERPTAGRLELFGQPAPVDPFAVKRRLGVVGESQYLYDDLSAWEYLQFFGRLYGVADAERRGQELLERLGLWDFRRLRARDHSRGMQQKLGLARALLHRPELLVLDEPVSGLDPHGIRQVREILLEENARGTTILISSHILSEVERTAHRVGILYGGRLVAEDTVAAIGARLRPEASIEVDVDHFQPALLDALRAAPFVRSVDVGTNGAAPDHGRLRIAVAPDGDHRRAVSQIVAAHGGLITEMRQQRVSLEEAFVALTTENVAPLSAPVVPGEGQDEGDTERCDRASSPGPRPSIPSPRGRARAIRVILLKDLLSTLFAPGVYIAIALGMLVAMLLVRDSLDAIARSHVLVLADAFTLPFFAAATIATFFLALSSAATVAREREQGTLEALFYGPVDHASYAVAKWGAQVAAYGPMALAIALLLVVYAGMTGLALSPGLLVLELLLSLFAAAAIAGLGVLLSTLTRGVRAAFALFIAWTVAFLAIHFGAEALSGIQITNNLNPLLFLRDLAIGLDHVASYVSPFGVFQNGVDALVRGDALGLAGAVATELVEAAVLVSLAAKTLERRGVRR